jgi:hypothetical protein
MEQELLIELKEDFERFSYILGVYFWDKYVCKFLSSYLCSLNSIYENPLSTSDHFKMWLMTFDQGLKAYENMGYLKDDEGNHARFFIDFGIFKTTGKFYPIESQYNLQHISKKLNKTLHDNKAKSEACFRDTIACLIKELNNTIKKVENSLKEFYSFKRKWFEYVY